MVLERLAELLAFHAYCVSLKPIGAVRSTETAGRTYRELWEAFRKGWRTS